MSACTFCAIIKNEVVAWKIFEDDVCVAILDIRPVQPGHTLIIPKHHCDCWYETEECLVEHLLRVGRSLAQVLQKELDPKRVAIAIAGMGEHHLHVHLVPMQSGEDLASRKEIEGNLVEAVGPDLLRMQRKLQAVLR